MFGIFSELMRKELDAECWGVTTNTTSVKIASERLFNSTHLRFYSQEFSQNAPEVRIRSLEYRRSASHSQQEVQSSKFSLVE
jgi:hypothetical protein